MTRKHIWIILAALTRLAAAESNDPTLTCEGWTIEAHRDRGRLTIKHERLGTILRDVRLNLEAGGVSLDFAGFPGGAAPSPAAPRTVAPLTPLIARN